MEKLLPVLMVVVFSLNACKPALNKPVTVTDQPTAFSKTATPQVTQIDEPSPPPTVLDSNSVHGNVYLDSTELLTEESSPRQFTLALKGNLPTPCDQLQVEASQPDAKNRVIVDVYSLTQPDKMCAQVLESFEKKFSLGSFPAGHYTLWVNGKKVAEFDA
jgi:hypothetical protein